MSGKWIVPPPPRKHRCEYPGAGSTFPEGVVGACACGKAWTNSAPHIANYSGWTRAYEHDLEVDDE